MNHRERNVLHELRAALADIPGVSNPASYSGKLAFYAEMYPLRNMVIDALDLLTDTSPEYREENRVDLGELLGRIKTWLEKCRIDRNASEHRAKEEAIREFHADPKFRWPIVVRRLESFHEKVAAAAAYRGTDPNEEMRLQLEAAAARRAIQDALLGDLGPEDLPG